MQKITVTSAAFGDGEMIPLDHTRDGAEISPPLEWAGVPGNAKSLALISEDPDAPSGDWVHWVVYDMPPDLSSLPSGVPASEKISEGGTQGRTDFGTIGYGGPCPPSGKHRYFFKLYALDIMTGLKPGATKQELLQAMRGHVLAEGKLTGTYQRA
ncbi:MAG TPA: YbhB/YbcL family Raf kinase inhibitor-like protein [Candidatus Omnitrophota bacterium]|nr:YbhB/YbcL family Raf kinase inhibitor-like protein [Candidatus Omnitrophota bacterium]HPS37407.1 YbhB/YbcL family Raf kinase inhibitor-like protein [Candidatus Omnitrophota bacterium]